MNSKIHPQTIIAGWRMATDCARAALTATAKDNSGDPTKFKEVLNALFSHDAFFFNVSTYVPCIHIPYAMYSVFPCDNGFGCALPSVVSGYINVPT